MTKYQWPRDNGWLPLTIANGLLPITNCKLPMTKWPKNISISSQFSYEFDSIELHSCSFLLSLLFLFLGHDLTWLQCCNLNPVTNSDSINDMFVSRNFLSNYEKLSNSLSGFLIVFFPVVQIISIVILFLAISKFLIQESIQNAS